jgi:hypothetical protein
MRGKLLVLLLLVGGSLLAGPRIYVGINAGGYYPGYYAAPPPPPVAIYVPPPSPGPGYAWVSGYWYPVGARYHWHAGYWARAPYRGAYWVAPHYRDHRYYRGYWARR